jgi:hypothetical protein
VAEERGAVVSVEGGEVIVGVGERGAITLDLGAERVREEGWRPGREAVLEFADDGITVESFRMVD